MDTPTAISPVRPDDHPRVVEVWEASVRATHHFLAPGDVELFKPLVRDALLHPIELACVRDAAGAVAGFVGVAEGKVEMLFIDPAARGQGIGRRLLRHAVDVLGATRVDVNDQNEQAVGFYLRMGFAVKGRSELDGMGKPYPLLHMRLRNEPRSTGSSPEGARAQPGTARDRDGGRAARD
jgi:putative acetyltransferase